MLLEVFQDSFRLTGISICTAVRTTEIKLKQKLAFHISRRQLHNKCYFSFTLSVFVTNFSLSFISVPRTAQQIKDSAAYAVRAIE